MTALPLSNLSNDVPILGPIGVGVGILGTTWISILSADPQRRGIVFANPGSNNLYVAPTGLSSQPADGAGAILIYPQNEFTLFMDNEHENVNTGWMGWVSSGVNQPVSILNFTGTNQSVPAPAPLASLNQGSVISSPVPYGVDVSTAVSAIISANSQRRGIAFHNPGNVPISVCPANLSVSYGVAGSIIVLPGATKTIMANPRSRIRCNCGWNGTAQSGSTNPLTILEFLG